MSLKSKSVYGYLCTAVFVTMMAVHCGGASGPEGVVKAFLDYAKAGKYEKIADCYPKSITEQPGAREKIVGMTKQSLESKDGVKSYSITGSEIEEEKATVSYTIEYNNGDTEENDVTCVKQDGKWFLSFK
jgi:hypothetical protein